VDDIHNFHRLSALHHSVHDDEGQRRQRKFARALHAAKPAAIREGSEYAQAVVDRLTDTLRGGRIIAANVINDVFEIGHRVG